jgi:membrane protein YdbS with pleckstrin-like domain
VSAGREPVTRWAYRGIWGVLTGWFRVPQHPPTLPTPPGEEPDAFRPARGFLDYMRLQFAFVMFGLSFGLFILWVALIAKSPAGGLLTAPLPIIALVVGGVVGFLALHLRYDTTWYVMSGRSIRLRRGIWVIRETTITYENVQNVTVRQGPVQRLFGIADVQVETAGGGAAIPQQQGRPSMGGHHGLIEGIANAQEIRDRILARLRRSRSAGLGDEGDHESDRAPAWGAGHVAVLREIRDALRA